MKMLILGISIGLGLTLGVSQLMPNGKEVQNTAVADAERHGHIDILPPTNMELEKMREFFAKNEPLSREDLEKMKSALGGDKAKNPEEALREAQWVMEKVREEIAKAKDGSHARAP